MAGVGVLSGKMTITMVPFVSQFFFSLITAAAPLAGHSSNCHIIMLSDLELELTYFTRWEHGILWIIYSLFFFLILSGAGYVYCFCVCICVLSE